MSRLTHNLKLLGLALVLSICSAYIIRNPEFLMSSVLNTQEIQEIEEKHRDIAYKTTGDMLDVFLPSSGSHYGQLSVRITYDPELILYTTQLTGQIEAKNIVTTTGTSVLTFELASDIKAHESIFWIPFSGNKNDILVEEAYLDTQSLAIGKLSQTSVHGK